MIILSASSAPLPLQLDTYQVPTWSSDLAPLGRQSGQVFFPPSSTGPKIRPSQARVSRESAKPEDMCLLCLGMCWSPEPVCSGPYWQHREAESTGDKEGDPGDNDGILWTGEQTEQLKYQLCHCMAGWPWGDFVIKSSESGVRQPGPKPSLHHMLGAF